MGSSSQLLAGMFHSAALTCALLLINSWFSSCKKNRNSDIPSEADGVINPPVTIGEGTDASVGNETIQGEAGVTGGEGAIGGEKSRESSSLPKGNVTAAPFEGDGEDYHNDEKRAKGKKKHHHVKKKNKKKKGGHKRSQDAAK